jgi:enterochelin esterase-like enzyme
MTSWLSRQRIAIAFILVIAASSAELAAQNIRSPELHPDGRVTFRLAAPNAGEVLVSVAGRQLTMSQGDDRVWTATSDTLPAGIHDYAFIVDGTRMIDPSNRNVKKWFTLASMVEVPGDPPLLTEFLKVPHGAVHRLIYNSESVGQQRPVMVYTPPGYEHRDEMKREPCLPLVVLMHGFGDDETAWTEVGRAHLIADNLIAQGKIEPVLIAMPYGHPVPVVPGAGASDYFDRNSDLYESDIVNDLLPFLEERFSVCTEPTGRSIVGLSMGGGHAIHIGLRHTDVFSAIGAFSAAAPQEQGDRLLEKYPALRGPDAQANGLRDLFIPIGEDDFLLQRNDAFAAQLRAFEVNHTYQKTEGGHEWKLWRRYLPQFLLRVVGKSAPSKSPAD